MFSEAFISYCVCMVARVGRATSIAGIAEMQVTSSSSQCSTSVSSCEYESRKFQNDVRDACLCVVWAVNQDVK